LNRLLNQRGLSMKLAMKKPRLSGAFSDAGGGTRTPDTRIMIPLL
jgi:hypothetical protein